MNALHNNEKLVSYWSSIDLYASKCEAPSIAFSADYCSLNFFSAASHNKFVKQMHYRFTPNTNSSYIYQIKG